MIPLTENSLEVAYFQMTPRRQVPLIHFVDLGAKIPPLDMLKMAIYSNIIHSFKSTSINEIYEKWGKRICDYCDEQLDEIELSRHVCSHNGYSILYLHEGRKDELMVIVYHKKTKEAENEVVEEDVVDLENMKMCK